MNLQPTLFKLFTITLLVFSFIFLYNTGEATATQKERQPEYESLMIMLSTDAGIDKKIEIIQKKFTSVKMKEIEAIDVVVAENVPNKDFDDFKEYAEIVLGVAEDEIVNDLPLAAPVVENTSVDSMVLLNSSAVKSPAVYNELLWDIKLVTNNYDSHKISKGSPDIQVGIIDSGIDFNHPALKDSIISAGHSFVPGEPGTQDYLGHGTMVAGVVAADGKMKGIAPDIGLVPYKVFDSYGANSSWVIEAIIQATDDDMDVVNLSLSTFKSMKNKEDKDVIKAYEKAFKYARKHNTTLVVSAGNEGLDISNPKHLADQLDKPQDLIVHLPGGSNHVITVAASDKKNLLSSYSNYGKNISITAPGGSYEFDPADYSLDLTSMTLTTFPVNLPQTFISQFLGLDPGYEMTVGTSVAAPKVTAVAALIKSEYEKKHNKEMKNTQVEKILYQSSMQFEGYDKHLSGSGIVNAYDALMEIKGNKKK